MTEAANAPTEDAHEHPDRPDLRVSGLLALVLCGFWLSDAVFEIDFLITRKAVIGVIPYLIGSLVVSAALGGSGIALLRRWSFADPVAVASSVLAVVAGYLMYPARGVVLLVLFVSAVAMVTLVVRDRRKATR